MTTRTTSATRVAMLPYNRMGEIDCDSLEFDPDLGERPPDHMQQSRQMIELFMLFAALFAEFWRRHDVFIDSNHFICYDPSNLNVRVAPDLYIAFGVDAEAIRSRGLYLPWEVGKPPGWALEVASKSTARRDVVEKRRIYAQIGIPEYFMFDPTGGEYHGVALSGERLVDGEYRPIPLSREPDGILKVYSSVLGVSLCWDNGWPRLYNPSTGEYVKNWDQEREIHRRTETELERTEAALEAEQNARAADQVELELLRERIRRLEAGN